MFNSISRRFKRMFSNAKAAVQEAATQPHTEESTTVNFEDIPVNRAQRRRKSKNAYRARRSWGKPGPAGSKLTRKVGVLTMRHPVGSGFRSY